MPKPEILAEHLRGLKMDPAATRIYEMMSGGFLWSDERPINYSDVQAGYAMRLLLAYRASLVRGRLREEFQFVWDEVLNAYPQWPGFVPERRGGVGLAADLEHASKVNARYLRRMDASSS